MFLIRQLATATTGSVRPDSPGSRPPTHPGEADRSPTHPGEVQVAVSPPFSVTTAFTPSGLDGESEADQERRDAARRRQERRGDGGAAVSRRAAGGGRAYPVATCTITHQPTVEEQQAEQNRRLGWIKDDLPGGRKLFFKLVVAFTLTAIFGAVFATLGGVFFKRALETNTLLLVFAIMGIVCGTLMVIGSFILAKTLISTKWRNNLQPNYANMAVPTARFVPTVPENTEDEPTVEIQLTPPSYEEAANSPAPQSVFIISSGNVSVNLPDTSPPGYAAPENKDLPKDAPPMYSVADPYDGREARRDSGESASPPAYYVEGDSYEIQVLSVASPISVRNIQQILSGQGSQRVTPPESQGQSSVSSTASSPGGARRVGSATSSPGGARRMGSATSSPGGSVSSMPDVEQNSTEAGRSRAEKSTSL